MSTSYDRPVDSTPSPSGKLMPIPLSKPFVTYILLGAIGLVGFLTELVGMESLKFYGANSGRHILYADEYWRLFTSMFLHANIRHLALNAFALFIFGLEMERIYGPARFGIIYILSGLFGSLASFASRGPAVVSLGASGAIFGVIGMNFAYFLLHRHSFGEFGRQRVMSTLIIIGINLVFGFTVPGIDNMAHIGGLIAGFILGYALAPRYQMAGEYTLSPYLEDKNSLLKRWWVPALAVVALVLGLQMATSFWLSQPGGLF